MVNLILRNLKITFQIMYRICFIGIFLFTQGAFCEDCLTTAMEHCNVTVSKMKQRIGDFGNDTARTEECKSLLNIWFCIGRYSRNCKATELEIFLNVTYWKILNDSEGVNGTNITEGVLTTESSDEAPEECYVAQSEMKQKADDLKTDVEQMQEYKWPQNTWFCLEENARNCTSSEKNFRITMFLGHLRTFRSPFCDGNGTEREEVTHKTCRRDYPTSIYLKGCKTLNNSLEIVTTWGAKVTLGENHSPAGCTSKEIGENCEFKIRNEIICKFFLYFAANKKSTLNSIYGRFILQFCKDYVLTTEAGNTFEE